jgi:hypothetical protein
MRKRTIKLTEADLRKIIKESVEEIIEDEEESFYEMEERVYDVSSPLKNSTAFQMAMDYIKKENPDLYTKLIITEYNEML